MNLKYIVNIMVLVFLLSILFVGAERVAFFQGHPFMPMKEKSIGEEESGTLARECKVKRGNNAVLEVLVIGEKPTYARCGMWYPFVDNYKIEK